MLKPNDFTLSGLSFLLQQFQLKGYIFSDFDKPVTEKGTVLLRHDVDVDLDAAHCVASLEAEMGVRATFFFLVSSPIYNIVSQKGAAICREIVAMGHKVGLHLDPRPYEQSGTTLQTGTLLEKVILEKVCGVEVRHFSVHRPSSNTTPVPVTLADMTSTYSDAYVKRISYSSDSMGWWKFGKFIDSQEFEGIRSVQLLLHPFWWFSDQYETPLNRIEDFVSGARAR